jgi:hypothetical protein
MRTIERCGQKREREMIRKAEVSEMTLPISNHALRPVAVHRSTSALTRLIYTT